jgi:hypothetical protein
LSAARLPRRNPIRIHERPRPSPVFSSKTETLDHGAGRQGQQGRQDGGDGASAPELIAHSWGIYSGVPVKSSGSHFAPPAPPPSFGSWVVGRGPSLLPASPHGSSPNGSSRLGDDASLFPGLRDRGSICRIIRGRRATGHRLTCNAHLRQYMVGVCLAFRWCFVGVSLTFG